MRNTLRTYVVSFLVLIMTINPAWACRSCGGGGGGWNGGYTYSQPTYYAPVYYGGWNGCSSCSTAVVVDSCSSCQPCGGCSSCGTVVSEGAPVESSSNSETKAPTEAAPDTHTQEARPAGPTEVEQAMPAAPQQPAKVERPIDNTPAPTLPSTPPAAPAAQPGIPLPDAESGQPQPPANDLFNLTPATPPAAEKPAAEAPAAAPPAAKPAASDDLFGAPAAAPAEKPATPPPAAEKPAETPAATPPAADTKAAAADDLFGAPPTAAPVTPPAAAPATPPAAAPAAPPAEKPAGEEKKDEKKADDIFGGSSNVLHEAGGLASDEMREWVDNTGTFSCHARLVQVQDGQVKLLKDNGRTTTVSVSRLSGNDLRFVERQASANQASVFQTAQSISAMPSMSN
jgi:hypothetical protein